MGVIASCLCLELVIKMPIGVEFAVEAWFGEIKKYHEVSLRM